MVSFSVIIFRIILGGVAGALVWFFLVPMVKEMYTEWAIKNGYKKKKKPVDEENLETLGTLSRAISRPTSNIEEETVSNNFLAKDIKEKIMNDIYSVKGLTGKNFKDIKEVLDRRIK